MQNRLRSSRPYARNRRIIIGTSHDVRQTTADGKGTGSMTSTDAVTGRQTTRKSRPTATASRRERAGGGRCETETDLIAMGESFRCQTVRIEMHTASTSPRRSASRTRASATLVTTGFRALPPQDMAPGIRRRSKTVLSKGRPRSVPRAPRASSRVSLAAGGLDGTACAGRLAAAGATTAGARGTGSVGTTNGSPVDGDVLSKGVFGGPEPM